MTRAPTDQTLAALIALGAVAAGQDEFVQQFAGHVLGLLDDGDIRRALRYILERDGGDEFIARVVEQLRRVAGGRPLPALDALTRSHAKRVA